MIWGEQWSQVISFILCVILPQEWRSICELVMNTSDFNTCKFYNYYRSGCNLGFLSNDSGFAAVSQRTFSQTYPRANCTPKQVSCFKSSSFEEISNVSCDLQCTKIPLWKHPRPRIFSAASVHNLHLSKPRNIWLWCSNPDHPLRKFPQNKCIRMRPNSTLRINRHCLKKTNFIMSSIFDNSHKSALRLICFFPSGPLMYYRIRRILLK